jgi:hypothetical protein
MRSILFAPLLAALLAAFMPSLASAQEDPFADIGINSWRRFRPGWALTVNDECLYEFAFEFTHDEELPMGDRNFEGNCIFKDPVTKRPRDAPDGLPYLSPRRHWEEFPDFVWETMGFNHLSVDFYPCGQRPKGFSKPQYAMSFFRSTPDFRVREMQCTLITEDENVIPGEEVCTVNQGDNVRGMRFFVVPASITNRGPTVNMPTKFTDPDQGPIPNVGLRFWDETDIPEQPGQWEDMRLHMATYDGDLTMWQPHIPYDMVSGDQDRFTSSAARYHETTIDTLPDTFGFDYDVSENRIRYVMVGKANLCGRAFEEKARAAGYPKKFPDYDWLDANQDYDPNDPSTWGSEDDAASSMSLAVVLLSSASALLLLISTAI